MQITDDEITDEFYNKDKKKCYEEVVVLGFRTTDLVEVLPGIIAERLTVKPWTEAMVLIST